MAKKCRSCTQCCKVMKVAELDKPQGVWCVHCNIGHGCSIYADRPGACRTFACQWLRDETSPHRLRPDQTKVVVIKDMQGQRLLAICDPANPMAWRREPFYTALKRWAGEAFGTGRQVAVVVGKHHWAIAPNLDLDLGELDQGESYLLQEMPDRTVKATFDPPRPSAT
ncbi:MAG TPA: YkgJ family cysteine cluster protein [Caulobacteraceae bacterium]|nr:YkgJ family cysteine cluster protein [Caulobacteraceae bacterium]